MDRHALTVHRADPLLGLTRTEHQLLELFPEHPGIVLTRSMIFETVWGYGFWPAAWR